MSEPLTHSFAKYLGSVRRREKLRLLVCALFLILVVAIAVVALVTLLGNERGYTDELVWGARLLIALLALVIGWVWLIRPWRALTKTRGTDLVEQTDPAFDGRAETWLNTVQKSPNHPFIDPLADDAMRIAQQVPKQKVVRTSAIAWPMLGLLVAVGLGFGFVQYANTALKNGASHLLLGWMKPGLVAQRELLVEPGSVELLYADDLTISASLEGFKRDTVSLDVKYGSADWQSTEISETAPGLFDFTLFRITEALQYRVSAKYVTSETFDVSVIEPARLERINARFAYPEWTSLDDKERSNVRSVSGVAETEVTLDFITDKPLTDPVLIVGLNEFPLTQVDNTATTTITLLENTSYQLSDRLLGRTVPISPEHPINLTGDNPPNVKFLIPGRDISASPVEEVLLGLDARDDFGITSIELLYSVNAGDWQSIDLETETTSEHIFYLESMGPEGSPLVPGDLISYYARVRDYSQVAETDMLLIDVRPFERRFSEQSSGGGAGGNAPGNEGADISKRQKEILLATWNLLRASDAAGGDTAGQRDNALLLSEMQLRLAEQATTLAERSEARSLTNQGELIREFVDYLREAVESMQPSADALESLNFSEAIKPQQRALQLLQRAEALFNDIRISQQSGQGQGGQQPGQDMTEMFELEMDLERNQYEQRDRPPSPAEAQSQALDDIFEKLAELAKRQQELTEEAKNNPELTRDERWRQEQLARELEQLQRELDALEQQSASTDQQSSESGENSSEQDGENSSDAQNAQSDSAASGSETENTESSPSDTDALREQLEQARAAMQEALESSANASNDGEQSAGNSDDTADNADANDAGDAADAASDALQQALNELSDNRAQDLQERIAEAFSAADEVLTEQRQTAEAIRDAVERAAQARNSGRYSPGMTREQSAELSQQKHDLQKSLEDIRKDVEQLQQRYSTTAPDTAELLEQANDALNESQAELMLGIAGDGVEEGAFATVLPGESLVTNAIRDYRDRLAEALDSAETESINTQTDDIQVADALRQLQTLRQMLEAQSEQNGASNDQGQSSEQSEQGQEGEQGQDGQRGQQGQQAQDSQQGQQGQDGQQGEQGQQGEDGQQGQDGQQGEQGQQGQQGQNGQQGQQGQDGQQGQGGQQSQQQGQAGLSSSQPSADGAQQSRARGVDANETADAIESLMPALNDLGFTEDDLATLENSMEELRRSNNGINTQRIEEQFLDALRQVELLELALQSEEGASSARTSESSAGRSVSESAADYFRRLSEN